MLKPQSVLDHEKSVFVPEKLKIDYVNLGKKRGGNGEKQEKNLSFSFFSAPALLAARLSIACSSNF